MAALILMFFMPGSFRNCDPKHQQGRWLWWTMPAFTSVMICWKRSAPISVRQSFFHLTAPTLTPLNTNGLKPKPSEGDTGVVLMNSFLSIHNMSFYNDLAIAIKAKSLEIGRYLLQNYHLAGFCVISSLYLTEIGSWWYYLADICLAIPIGCLTTADIITKWLEPHI